MNLANTIGKSPLARKKGLGQLRSWLSRQILPPVVTELSVDAAQLEDRVLFSAAPLDVALPQDIDDPNLFGDLEAGLFPDDASTDSVLWEIPKDLNEDAAPHKPLSEADPSSLVTDAELSPSDLSARLGLATSEAHAGRLEAARQVLEEAVPPQRDDIRLLNTLGLVYRDLGRPEQAAETLRRSLARSPDQPAVREMLGTLESSR